MTRKVMTIKQLAYAYGVDFRTLQKDMARQEKLYFELDAAGFDGRKFYPVHQKIIFKYFGELPN